MQIQRRNFALGMIGVFAVLLAGCASGPRISSEADPEADFGSYRSFGFYAPLALEKEGYATPTTDRIKAAARAQMESRGYVFSADQPDLWVNLNAYMQEKTDVSFHSDRRLQLLLQLPRAQLYRGAVLARSDQCAPYTEGTLNVDLVDPAKNRLVWEGIAVGRVSKVKPEERGARIDSAMAEIFARFPYRASASTP